jgi:hypothetical protein
MPVSVGARDPSAYPGTVCNSPNQSRDAVLTEVKSWQSYLPRIATVPGGAEQKMAVSNNFGQAINRIVICQW